MLGSDLKSLIRMYKNILYDNDGLKEFLGVDEKVLKELLIEDDSINFLDEERLQNLYDIALLEVSSEYKIEVIKAIKQVNSSRLEILFPIVQTLYDIYGNNGSVYFKLMCEYPFRNEELEELIEYINELVDYDSEKDISLTFLELTPKALLNQFIKIKSSIVDFATEDITRIEMLLDKISIESSKERIDNLSTYSMILLTLFEKIEYLNIDVCYTNSDYGEEEFSKRISEILDIVYGQLETSIEKGNCKKFASILEFVNLIDLNEVDIAKRVLDAIKQLEDIKVELICKIYQNMDLVIDLDGDAQFIEKLCDLDEERLKCVESFTKRFCTNASEPYDYDYLYTDPRIIDRYEELSRILKKNGNAVDNLFDLSDTLEREIEYAIDDEEALEDSLAYIKDAEDIVPAMLKFTYVKGKK